MALRPRLATGLPFRLADWKKHKRRNQDLFLQILSLRSAACQKTPEESKNGPGKAKCFLDWFPSWSFGTSKVVRSHWHLASS